MMHEWAGRSFDQEQASGCRSPSSSLAVLFLSSYPFSIICLEDLEFERSYPEWKDSPNKQVLSEYPLCAWHLTRVGG